MNRHGLAILCALLVATAGFTQSLGELAKKERERRQKTKGPVRVIDSEALEHGRREPSAHLPLGVGPQRPIQEEPAAGEDTNGDGPAEPAGPGQSSASASTQGASSPSGAESFSDIKARRQKCADDLRTAEEEKKRQQALFDQGIAQVAVIDTTTSGPKPQGTPIGIPYRQAGVDRNGVPIMVPAGSPPAKVNVEGTRVSCVQALSNKSMYPQEASKCAELQNKISAADQQIKKALDCVRSR